MDGLPHVLGVHRRDPERPDRGGCDGCAGWLAFGFAETAGEMLGATLVVKKPDGTIDLYRSNAQVLYDEAQITALNAFEQYTYWGGGPCGTWSDSPYEAASATTCASAPVGSSHTLEFVLSLPYVGGTNRATGMQITDDVFTVELASLHLVWAGGAASGGAFAHHGETRGFATLNL